MTGAVLGTEPADTARGSALPYDATDDQYTLILDTEKSWAKSCRMLELVLTDGTDTAASRDGFHFER